MGHKVVMTPIARACQTASLLLILVMVLGMLVADIMGNVHTANEAHAETCQPDWSCPGLAWREQAALAGRSLP